MFHDCLAQYKIGAQSLKFAANEVERLAENRVILEKKRRRVKAGKSTKEVGARTGSRKADQPSSFSFSHSRFRLCSLRLLQEYEMLVEEMAEQSFRQETLLYVALHLLLNLAEDTRVEMKVCCGAEICGSFVSSFFAASKNVIRVCCAFACSPDAQQEHRAHSDVSPRKRRGLSAGDWAGGTGRSFTHTD